MVRWVLTKCGDLISFNRSNERGLTSHWISRILRQMKANSRARGELPIAPEEKPPIGPLSVKDLEGPLLVLAALLGVNCAYFVLWEVGKNRFQSKE